MARSWWEAALARGLGNSPEEVIEHALEALGGEVPVSREVPVLTEEEKERRRKAVEGIRDFMDTHHLTLSPGLRIKDLIREGHKY